MKNRLPPAWSSSHPGLMARLESFSSPHGMFLRPWSVTAASSSIVSRRLLAFTLAMKLPSPSEILANRCGGHILTGTSQRSNSPRSSKSTPCPTNQSRQKIDSHRLTQAKPFGRPSIPREVKPTRQDLRFCAEDPLPAIPWPRSQQIPPSWWIRRRGPGTVAVR